MVVQNRSCLPPDGSIGATAGERGVRKTSMLETAQNPVACLSEKVDRAKAPKALKAADIGNAKLAMPDPQSLESLRVLATAGAGAPFFDAWVERWGPRDAERIAAEARVVITELQKAQGEKAQSVPPALVALANLLQLEKARCALAAYSAQSQVLLDAVSRQGYSEVSDAAAAAKNNISAGLFGKNRANDGANLRVNDAGRALLRDQVALASVKHDLETGALDGRGIDVMAEATRRSSDPQFDAKEIAAKLAGDPDFKNAELVIKNEEGFPQAALTFGELDSWGRRVKSSMAWLYDGGTRDNMNYWHALPVVAQLREQTKALIEADASKKDDHLRLALLRIGLTMSKGGAVNARLEPNLLVNAAKAAGLPLVESVGSALRSPEALCRDLRKALDASGLPGLSSSERAALAALVGPKDSPGADFAKRVSKEHWATFWRTSQETAVVGAVAAIPVALAAPALAVVGAGTVTTAAAYSAIGVVSSAVIDGVLEGRAPTPESVVTGAALGLVAGGATGSVSKAMSKQLLGKASGNAVGQAVARGATLLGTNALGAAGSTALNHSVGALKDGTPFTENLEEDFLRSMIGMAAGQAVSLRLANLGSVAKQVKVRGSTSESAVKGKGTMRADANTALPALGVGVQGAAAGTQPSAAVGAAGQPTPDKRLAAGLRRHTDGPGSPDQPRTIRVVNSVQSPAEFRLAMEAHRQRVKLLAIELVRAHPSDFPDVDLKVLRQYAKYHDWGKMGTSPKFLERFGLERPLSEPLAEAWGVKLKANPDSPNRIVDSLNKVDHALDDRFFARRGIRKEVADQYKLAMKIPDETDRPKAPLSQVEELGKMATPLTEYRAGASDQFMRLATWLEANYKRIIPERLNYFDLKDALLASHPR